MNAIVIGVKKDPKNFLTKRGEAQSYTCWLLCKSEKVNGYWSCQEQIADYMLKEGVSLSVGAPISLYRSKGDDGVYRLRAVFPVSDDQVAYALLSDFRAVGGDIGADVV